MSKQLYHHLLLSDYIYCYDVTVMSCSNCAQCKKTCYYLKDSEQCSKYTYYKMLCNVLESFLDNWSYLNNQQKKLDIKLAVTKVEKETVKIYKEKIYSYIC